MRFRLFLKLTTLLVAALFATQVMAQSIVTGDIVGTVTDPSNAVVSGATVTMASPSTGSTETTTTNSTGFYRFALVKPGTYKLSVAQSGFRTISAMVSVDIGKVNTANLQLEGVYLTLAALLGAIRDKGVLNDQEIEKLLNGVEQTLVTDPSRPTELRDANVDAICFPVRFLRHAMQASAKGGAYSFAHIASQVARRKPDR